MAKKMLGSYMVVASFMGLVWCSTVRQEIRSGGLRTRSLSAAQLPHRPRALWERHATLAGQISEAGENDCTPVRRPRHSLELSFGVFKYSDLRDMRYSEHGSERCFTWHSPRKVNGPLPVVVYFPGVNAYARIACHQRSKFVQRAHQKSFALICADPNGLWHIPKYDDDDTCSDNDSPEILYVKTILDFIQQRPEELDSTHVYFVGHSLGAMVAGWASACFSSKIRGLAQMASGLKLHGKAVEEEFCALDPDGDCVPGIDDGIHTPMSDCEQDDCQFFPIRPFPTKNVAGEPLPRCLMAGCDDGLKQSVDLLAVYLERISMPYTLLYYDGNHSMPDTLVSKVLACLELPGQHRLKVLLKNHTCATTKLDY